MAEPLTQGCHHIGLTVSRLEASAAFFTGALGWREVRRDADYPAIHVSDGRVMVTLWQLREGPQARGFDRHHHAGLHHLALIVPGAEALDEAYRRLAEADGVAIEFAPEPLRQGPAKHMMCREPSGLRVELIWPGP